MASSLQLMKCGWNLIHGTNVETFFTSGRTPSAVRKLFEDLSIYLKEHLGAIASTWVYFITDDHNTLTICQLNSTELNVSVIKSIQMFTNQRIKIRIESKDCTKFLMADLRIETAGNLKLLIRRVVGASLSLGRISFEHSPITSPIPAPAQRIHHMVPNLGLENLVVGSGGDKDMANMEDMWDTETLDFGNTNTSKTGLETSGTHTTACPLQDSQSPSKGRKNIRTVMDEKELTETTRQAAKDEEKRKKRLAEKKQFNSCFSPPQSDVIQQLVLDFDENTNIPIISVDPEVVKKLKVHQIKGIQFMWNNCFESLNKKGEGGGCILAHCMGLGKTLQTVAFLHTVLSHKDVEIKSALIICPLNTVEHWYSEFQMWLKNVSKRIYIHRLYKYAGKRRVDALEDWKRSGGVGIIHYESFRTLANAVNPPPVKSDGKAGSKPIKQMFSHRELKLIEDVLLNPGPGIVVCDEGHLLKNAASKLTSALGNFKTQRRIILTGTPLQNNLVEYHTMMNFVKPNLLGNTKEFANLFVNPITNGQHKDSDELDVKLMKRRAHVLHKILDGCVQRLDYSVLTPYLPPKLEYAIFINLSELQKNMYSLYINQISFNANIDRSQESKFFSDIIILSKIWTHPKILTYKDKAKTMDKKRDGSGYDSEGSLKDFIDFGESSELEVGVGTGDDDIEVLGTAGPSAKAKNGPVAEIGTLPNVEKPSRDWYKTFLTKEVMDSIEVSGKLIVLKNILEASADIGDKIIVFSQYITTLDLIEELLEKMDKKADKVMSFPTLLPSKEKVGRWRVNFEYFRIDGNTKTEDRKKQCDTFNIETSTRVKLFLISTKTGGLGINLVGANRVVIFDASWNPSQDLQSIFRVYRFGQVKPCYVYRLIARGTMEEIIYNRQVVKLSLSCRVVDEQQIERHYQYGEINKMYQFNPNDAKERPVPIVPKDRLLGELLMSQENWIFSYLEHDSLLENQEEEELTKEDREAAWNEYQNNEGQI